MLRRPRVVHTPARDNSVRREQIPSPVLEQYAHGVKHDKIAALVLFADVSGFTALTEALSVLGHEGAEVLAGALAKYFDPLVEAVFSQQGFITGFAGDAFTAVFPDMGDEFSLNRVLVASDLMRSYFAQNPILKTPRGEFPFGLKLGLCSDWVHSEVVSAEGAKPIFFFHGPGIDRAASAEHLANRGDLIVTQEVYQRILSPLGEARAGGCFALVRDMGLDCWGALVSGEIPAEVGNQQGDTAAADDTVFLSPEMCNFPAEGEFREVVSVFLSFEAGAPRQLVSTMAQIFGKLGGDIVRVEFGDKGAMGWAFFGAPVSLEEQADRALTYVSELIENHPNAMIHAGITLGVVYTGFLGGRRRAELTCLGRTVNIAARLMQRSPAGEIWCTEAVKKQSQRFDFESRGEQMFKGLNAPTAVWALRSKLGHAVHDDDSKEHRIVVGRLREMAQLESSIEPVFSEQFAGVIYVEGDTGCGKSVLIRAAKERLEDLREPKPLWVIVDCEPMLPEPLGPFKTAFLSWVEFSLNQLVQNDTSTVQPSKNYSNEEKVNIALTELIQYTKSADPELATEIERDRSILLALVGIVLKDSVFDRLDPAHRMTNQILALEHWVWALMRRYPVILWVEDAMWLDEESQKVVTELIRAQVIDTPRFHRGLCFLCSSRPDSQGVPFRLKLPDEVNCIAITLGELTKEAIEQLAKLILGAMPSKNLVELLQRASAGNPFLVEQLVRWLADKSMLQWGSGEVDVDGDLSNVPDSMSAVLVSRLDRLDTSVRRTVQAGAVLGREVDGGILSSMLAKEGGVFEHVMSAEKAKVWSRDLRGRLLFHHGLLRTAAYNMLTFARRRSLHKKAAEAIENMGASADIAIAALAYHWDHAEEPQKAAYYLRKAAATAQAKYRLKDALSYYDRLLSWVPVHGVERYEIELARANIFRDQMRWSDCLDACTRAKSANPTTNVQLSWLEAGALSRLGRLQEAKQCVDSAYELAIAEDDKKQLAMVCNRIGEIDFMMGNYSDAKSWFVKAESLAGEVMAFDVQASSANSLGFLAYLIEGTRQSLVHLERALGHHLSAGRPGAAALVLNNMGVIYWNLGEPEKSVSVLNDSIARAKEAGDRNTEIRAFGNLGLPYFSLQKYAESLDCFAGAIRAWKTIGEPNPFFHVARIEVLVRTGNLKQAEEEIPSVKAQVELVAQAEHDARFALAYGHYLRLVGRTNDAEQCYHEAAEKAASRKFGMGVTLLQAALDALKKGDPIPSWTTG